MKGLLENHLDKARDDLKDVREAVKALFELVLAPREQTVYGHYFCAAV